MMTRPNPLTEERLRGRGRERLSSKNVVIWLLIAAGLLFRVCAAAPDRVEQWGIYEVELKGPSDGNPFLDVMFSAIFSNGSKSVEVAGFYDGDGVYRVRFMPDRPGQWRYETKSNRWPLTGKRGAFRVGPPKPSNHGPVRV